MSRATFAKATATSEKSLARIEAGEDVRLSTYLAIEDYFAQRRVITDELIMRIALLPRVGRERVLELILRFEKLPYPSDLDDSSSRSSGRANQGGDD